MKRFLFLSFLLIPFSMSAQNHHEIGLTFGVANYYGDLQTQAVPWGRDAGKTYKPSVGIVYKYFMNPRIGLRFGATYMRISGADSLSNNAANKLRNLNFTNDIGELYGAFEFNFLPVDFNKFKVSPYLFAGIGAFYSNPYTNDNQGEKTYLRNLGTEGQGLPNYPDRKVYPVINAMIPIGGGVKFFIGETVMLSAEVGLRYAATDYLDDVSRSYVNMDTLQMYRGQKSVDLSYRGNENPEWDKNYPNYQFARGDHKKNDWYWTAGITATVYFDAFGNVAKYIQTKCPKIFGRR